jgi:hypothetical protein
MMIRSKAAHFMARVGKKGRERGWSSTVPFEDMLQITKDLLGHTFFFFYLFFGGEKG